MQENNQNSILIEQKAAEKLIQAHDGAMALLYLHTLLHGCYNAEAAAGDLCMTMSEVTAAAEKLQRMGLGAVAPSAASAPAAAAAGRKPSEAPVRPESVQHTVPAAECPQYTPSELAKRADEDPAFTAILAEARTVLGRTLSGPDMNTLLGIYDYLGMPPDVIMMLINYCSDNAAAGPENRRRLSLRTIEHEAYYWANRGIMTFELAEEYMSHMREKKSRIGGLRSAFGLNSRELSKTQAAYLDAWIDAGFDDSALAEAYDRTMTNTGKMAWQYMDKILQNWKGQGLLTAAAVEEKDPRHREQAAGSSPSAAVSDTVDLETLKGLVNKI